MPDADGDHVVRDEDAPPAAARKRAREEMEASEDEAGAEEAPETPSPLVVPRQRVCTRRWGPEPAPMPMVTTSYVQRQLDGYLLPADKAAMVWKEWCRRQALAEAAAVVLAAAKEAVAAKDVAAAQESLAADTVQETSAAASPSRLPPSQYAPLPPACHAVEPPPAPPSPQPQDDEEARWLAPLTDAQDAAAAQPVLKITNVTAGKAPFCGTGLRQYLEAPRRFVKQLDEDTYQIIQQVVYADYEDVDVARRQRRRLQGTAWPGGDGACLEVEYVTRDAATAAVAAQQRTALTAEQRLRETMMRRIKLEASAREAEAARARKEREAEAERLRKEHEAKAAEALEAARVAEERADAAKAAALKAAQERAKPLVLEELFSQTTAEPRLYYKFETDREKIAEARRAAAERVKELLQQ
eukprot:TRINITY_DN403_c0_g1_i1.p2 TRINITY_DN403_c0_g1~~TRINITY_DN403_c0_g1_i1.p2  ORF type:complete len:466 (+),score=201.84 TRINITY_DN403_c0_g1_i1:157-1398(+)